MKIAVISDTHGLLRPSVLARIGDAEMIIHAGDVGDAEILETLRAIAPTHAVRGNTDTGEFGKSLPPSETITLGGGLIHVVHDSADLALDPAEAGIRLVVFGHSHKPEFHVRTGVGYLNPGSCGPRRFKLPISFATLDWSPGGFRHAFLELDS